MYIKLKEINIELYEKNQRFENILFTYIIFLGLSDPYVKFKMNGRLVYKSKTVYKSLNPTWDETFTYLLNNPFEPIFIKV